jgi:hypothetical protein
VAAKCDEDDDSSYPSELKDFLRGNFMMCPFGDTKSYCRSSKKSRDVRKWPISTESLCYSLSAVGET